MKPAHLMVLRAEEGDLQDLLILVREFCAIDQHPFDEGMVREALGPLLRDDRYGVVYLLQRPVDGYAVVTWGYSLESGGRDALLDEIYVRDRGQGAGGRFLEHILADLSGRGLKRMFLETEDHNKVVRRFYARHGFEQEASVWMSREIE